MTAGGILGSIDRERFEVIPIGITRAGVNVLESDDPERYRVIEGVLPEVADNGTRIRWPESIHDRALWVIHPDGREENLGDIDLVFPILHGLFGEDGTLQGRLELTGLPYVGNGVLASALGMDKHFTKTVAQHAGIRVAPWAHVPRHRWDHERAGVLEEAAALGYPLFVKPVRAGSSMGVSRVADVDALDAAMERAFIEDHRVLIESEVSGREVEIALLGGRIGEPTRASVAGEVVMGDLDFYDFEAKYIQTDEVTLLCPAPLSEEQHAEMARQAILAFDAIGGEGLARVDFFLTAEGFVLNEINTMPGFTPFSMYPMCWAQTGMSYPELLTELIEVALNRRALR